MKMEPAKKMSVFTPSIFGKLKAVTAKREAQNEKIIDLSLGSPDIPPSDLVRQTLSKESAKADMYGYTLGGIKRFNEAVSNYYQRRSKVSLNPETEVLQTMGSQEGLVHLPLAFCNENDIVLTTNPAYVAYDAGIKLAGAIPYYMPLHAENNFLPDLDAIPENILEQAKLLILNLPGNPVPAIPTKAFFEKVVSFAKKYQIIVLHDAAYSEFYFTENSPASFLATPGAKEVGLEINSLSKSFSLAGARVAYFAGNADAIRIMREFKSNLDYGIFAPIQEAAIVALNHAEEITDRLRKIFKERHQILTEGLTELGWEVTPSSGGMFIWAKYPYEIDDKEFAFKAIEQVGVVMVPGSAFGTEGKGFVRIALVQDVEELKLALQLLKGLDM
ncbi:aminotransferase class I/II-fold pyridoxal phosphate-dependent enzyme [Cerasibacillus terrae]|uniref:Aminotransferase n=1 Tax=Cerasibacillus terrae TaxID=2498845 RepID=A0A5C8P272_9BACI|nr:aminotransferase class I/II-fold pyridoxal phosphate-dependent enzyme [Cerasibacillus terrae]TXL67482.1 aminotransferase class I/II-fold pyridoxal phosphate-dependent enzyme [Cerasibacillus terrae]